MPHPFVQLVEALAGVERVPALPLARLEPPPPGETLEIDFAVLLGLEPAPYLVAVLSDLSAADFYRMGQTAEELRVQFLAQGWQEPLCNDVAMLCTMHRAPDHLGSGKALIDLWGLLATKAKFRGLFMWLLERVGRSFPDLVRPELRMEILLLDARIAQIEAAQKGETVEDVAITPTGDSLPLSERSPNA